MEINFKWILLTLLAAILPMILASCNTTSHASYSNDNISSLSLTVAEIKTKIVNNPKYQNSGLHKNAKHFIKNLDIVQTHFGKSSVSESDAIRSINASYKAFDNGDYKKSSSILRALVNPPVQEVPPKNPDIPEKLPRL